MEEFWFNAALVNKHIILLHYGFHFWSYHLVLIDKTLCIACKIQRHRRKAKSLSKIFLIKVLYSSFYTTSSSTHIIIKQNNLMNSYIIFHLKVFIHGIKSLNLFSWYFLKKNTFMPIIAKIQHTMIIKIFE